MFEESAAGNNARECGVQVSGYAGFVDSEGLHCRLHAVVAGGLPQEVDGEAVVDVRGRARTA